jgi:hypothetical protein
MQKMKVHRGGNEDLFGPRPGVDNDEKGLADGASPVPKHRGTGLNMGYKGAEMTSWDVPPSNYITPYTSPNILTGKNIPIDYGDKYVRNKDETMDTNGKVVKKGRLLTPEEIVRAQRHLDPRYRG